MPHGWSFLQTDLFHIGVMKPTIAASRQTKKKKTPVGTSPLDDWMDVGVKASNVNAGKLKMQIFFVSAALFKFDLCVCENDRQNEHRLPAFGRNWSIL